MLSTSIEDYIKAIYKLEVKEQKPTTKRIAERIGVKMASVTGMMKHLAAEGYVRHFASPPTSTQVPSSCPPHCMQCGGHEDGTCVLVGGDAKCRTYPSAARCFIIPVTEAILTPIRSAMRLVVGFCSLTSSL